MVYKIEDTNCVKELFANWEETIIWSCLQGVMGAVYADDKNKPKSAMAILGDFCFFAGVANEEIVKYKPDDCEQDFIIMVPQNEEWGNMIEKVYKENAGKVERYAIKKETNVFDEAYLSRLVENIPEGCVLQWMDEQNYMRCKKEIWSKDLVSQFPTYDKYKELGLGVVLLSNSEIVTGASSYSAYLQGIEIQIDTKEKYRRRGFATICGAKLILECLHRGLYPSWDAQNKGSVALAEKLGYHYAYAYTAYEIANY